MRDDVVYLHAGSPLKRPAATIDLADRNEDRVGAADRQAAYPLLEALVGPAIWTFP
jgi:hypothetical protein